MARVFAMLLLHLFAVSAKQFEGKTFATQQQFVVIASAATPSSISIQFGHPECSAAFEKNEKDIFVVVKDDPSTCTPECFNRGLSVDIDQETMYFKPNTKRCMVETAKAI